MNFKKSIIAVIVSVVCILVNMGGKFLAEVLALPVMLDSIGTMVCAYLYGPVCGAIVGGATNIAYFPISSVAYVYSLTNITAGIIIGFCAKRKMFDNLFGILSSAFLVTIASVLISTPLNFIFGEGFTGNKWSDGVINLLNALGANHIFSAVCGEFYLDFVDKVLSVLIVAGIIRLYRRFASKRLKKKVLEMISISLAVMFCFVSLPANASANMTVKKQDTFLQTVYDAGNGLPGGVANDIAQTKDGILWVATYGGLYRYNGNEFRLMSNFESVKNANCLFTDSEGRLWIGTNDSGLSICVNTEISNILNSESGLPSDSVRYIAQGENGIYYVGTSNALALVTLSNGLKVTGVIPEITYAKSISSNGKYVVAVSDTGRLFLLDGDTIVARTYLSWYSCCQFSEDGKLYAGTISGEVEEYDVSEGSFSWKGSMKCGDLGSINSLNFVPTGEMIVCAENGAGYITEFFDYKGINLGSFSSCIDHTLVDYQGNIWLTSSRLGLLKLCRSPFVEIYNRFSLEATVVNCVAKWRGVMYFGTDTGIDAVNTELTQRVENVITDGFDGTRIRSLMTDTQGNLWVCTAGNGAICVDGNMMSTSYGAATGALSDKARSSLETSSGDILIASDLGISCVRNGEIAYNLGIEDGLDIPKVLCMLEIDNGVILAGTDGNGIAVIKDEKVLTTLTNEHGLTSGVVMRIVASKDGNGYYIVTSNSLCYMDKNYNIRCLNNFPYYNNYDVVERDDGMLFVLGSAGIHVIDRDNLLNGGSDYTLLDYSRGLRLSLTSNSWNYLDEDDNLFLSCGSGVVCFNLNDYSVASRSYRMTLSSIQVDNDYYISSDGETFTLPRGAAKITISPDIANYSPNDPNISLYLEGFDSEPKIMSLSEVTGQVYTNLPRGTYKFHIAILDEKGAVTAENVYTIIKEKEIYDEWWFLLYVWVVLIALIVYIAWLLFRTQLQRTLNIQKRELEVAKRQIEMGNEAIMTIARTVDAKDMNTSQHSFRVSEYSVLIAKRLGFDEEQCEELRKTALLHDIGKIGIPDNVLNKPAKLTDEEYAIMKTHVIKGAEILENFTSVKNIVEGAKYHHERYDGKGYMEGLKGEEIPINARIIGIADAFDAMTANRVYRKQLDIDFVLHELQRCRGTQFDPKLTDILLMLIDEGIIDVEKLYAESKNAAERREAK